MTVDLKASDPSILSGNVHLMNESNGLGTRRSIWGNQRSRRNCNQRFECPNSSSCGSAYDFVICCCNVLTCVTRDRRSPWSRGFTSPRIGRSHMGLKIEIGPTNSIKCVAAAIAIIDATAFFLESSHFISFHGATTHLFKNHLFFIYF